MKQIYIVDDDESVRRALQLLTVACGFVTEVFPSAETFFSAIPNSSPGCLILDVCMPGLNGWDAQQLLKKSKSNRPVIMISGDKDSDFRERAISVGAVGFLHKPFNDQELISLVNKAFQIKKSRGKYEESS